MSQAILAYRAWDSIIKIQTQIARAESTYVYQTTFREIENNQCILHFYETAGKPYRFKLLSRKLDSLTKIEFIPEGTDHQQPIGKRESDVRFVREQDYYSYTFYYTRALETSEVKIVFDGIAYDDIDPKDFVLFVFKSH